MTSGVTTVHPSHPVPQASPGLGSTLLAAWSISGFTVILLRVSSWPLIVSAALLCPQALMHLAACSRSRGVTSGPRWHVLCEGDNSVTARWMCAPVCDVTGIPMLGKCTNGCLGSACRQVGCGARKGAMVFPSDFECFSLGDECLKSWPSEKQVAHTPAQPAVKCAFPAGVPLHSQPCTGNPYSNQGLQEERTGMEQMQEHGKGRTICLHTGTLSAGSKCPARRLVHRFTHQ